MLCVKQIWHIQMHSLAEYHIYVYFFKQDKSQIYLHPFNAPELSWFCVLKHLSACNKLRISKSFISKFFTYKILNLGISFCVLLINESVLNYLMKFEPILLNKLLWCMLTSLFQIFIPQWEFENLGWKWIYVLPLFLILTTRASLFSVIHIVEAIHKQPFPFQFENLEKVVKNMNASVNNQIYKYHKIVRKTYSGQKLTHWIHFYSFTS